MPKRRILPYKHSEKPMLKNAWYVAAWADEVTDKPVETMIIGERVALYRKADGTPAALTALCPHRRLPLAMGRIDGDNLACGYHGMTFAPDGQCVKVPCQQGIPDAAHIRGYAVEERYGLIWIWMGDAARADPATIITVEHWGSPDWGYNRGAAMTYDCNYLYITDNLLDPSHVAWVHRTSFGDASCETVPLKTREAASGFTVSRWLHDVPVAPFYRALVPFAGNTDRMQHYEVRFPSLAVIKAVFVPAGEGGEGREINPASGFLMDSYNFITPVDEKHSRYYWFQMRNIRPDDAALSAQMSEAVLAAFSEDLAVLNGVQRGMDASDAPFISIATDAGNLRFRHKLQKMIDAEAAQTPP